MEILRHCFPPNLRRFLNELPDTLDETYDRILRGINKAQKEDARRLLRCLVVASRPLHVEELAELLAFDFPESSSGGIPALREDWRWDDQEEAVLSTCSSLITIVRRGSSRIVQFSHFSVKEYLTSHRLARSPHGDISPFHIDFEPAHMIMTQACLATLLRQDRYAGKSFVEVSPLVKYAAQYWVDHAQFDTITVSPRMRDGIYDLFDTSQPHFAAWLHVHDIDERWEFFSPDSPSVVGSPLYYAAFCGYYDLVQHLIIKHPEQVNATGGRICAPLPAALYKRHFRVADLLYRHGAVVDVQGFAKLTPLHGASASGKVDTIRWLLDHGANANARDDDLWTPLYMAAFNIHPEAVQVLLESNADINFQDVNGETPLNKTLTYLRSPSDEKIADMVRRLLEQGADPNIRRHDNTTALHRVSYHGSVEVGRLLLSYGAKVDEKDESGRTPFQIASSRGKDEMTKLLIEYGAVPQP